MSIAPHDTDFLLHGRVHKRDGPDIETAQHRKPRHDRDPRASSYRCGDRAVFVSLIYHMRSYVGLFELRLELMIDHRLVSYGYEILPCEIGKVDR